MMFWLFLCSSSGDGISCSGLMVCLPEPDSGRTLVGTSRTYSSAAELPAAAAAVNTLHGMNRKGEINSLCFLAPHIGFSVCPSPGNELY